MKNQTKNNLKGLGPNLAEMNLALYGRVDPDSIGLNDNLKNLYDVAMPILNNKIIGKVIIISTSGLGKDDTYFKDIWDKTEKYEESDE